jgi:ABC-type multidrug transport system fused ATPase/permease subunit
MMDDQDRSELVRIATALSQRRSSVAAQPRPGVSLGDIDENAPALNPENRDFDLEKWLARFIEQLSEEGITEKCMGVSYRNLDVFGSGEALQLQDTVGSTLAAPLKLGEFFSFNKKEHKQILHSFDGLMKPGELLIVLGRPGSGCSTLLKTLCGELEGLKIGDKTKVHYNGIPQKQMMNEFKGEMVYNQEVS